MRKQLWSALVSGWALSLLCAGVTQAQVPSQRGGNPYQAAYSGPGMGENPSQIVPTQYIQQPGGQLPPAFEPYQVGPENAQAQLQMPPLNPFPATSPYDHAFDQTFNEDGLWFRRVRDGRPIFYTSIDFWGATLKAPEGATVGEPVQSNSTAWDQANILPNRILQEVSLANPDALSVAVTTSFNNLDVHNFNTPQNLQALNPDLRRLGMRFTFGEVNPDMTGMELQGFFLVSREQGRTFTNGSIDRSPDPDASSTSPLFVDPASTTLVPINNTGRLTFDEGYQLTYQSQAWGVEANMFGITPINRDESMFIRTIFGARYFGTSNSMNIYGQYSDLNGLLQIDITEQDPNDPAAVIESSSSDPNYIYVPRSSFSLNSKAVSHLVGPQFGIQPELGGKNFKVIGWAKFAPMANFESLSVSTQNYGLPFMDGAQSVSYKKNNAHYSSLIELGTLIQAPVFQYIPFVRNTPVLKTGVLRIGFDWMYVTDIARSEKSVKYYEPLPKLQAWRTEQSLYGWFGGVGFTF